MKGLKKFFKTFKDVTPIALKPMLKKNSKDFWMTLISSFLQSTFLGLNIIVQAKFFQYVNEYINGGPVQTVALWMGIFFSFIIFQQIINAVVNFYINKFIQSGYKVIENNMMRKIKNLKPLYFEDPDNLLKLSRARAGAQDVILFLVLLIMSIAGYLPLFIIPTVYMAGKNASLALIFPLLLLPAILAYFVKVKIFVKMRKEETQITRVRDEYRKYIVGPAAKEMRMGGFYNFLYGKYKTGWEAVKSLKLKANLKIFIIETLLQLVSASAYVGVIYLIIRATLLGDADAGFLAATIGSMEFMFKMLEEFLTNFFQPIAERYSGIEFYLQLMNEPDQEIGKNLTDIEKIAVRNLSFKYPKAEDYAVKDVNLDLEKNKLLAIVGENGSGKSTLLKLILGLYDSGEGNIKYYDKMNQEIIGPNLREKASAIFQDYYKYKMQLDENIEISDLNKNESYKGALEKAGLSENMAIFPQGGSTILARDFHGVDLSGGQWQRVAIARGVYRDRDIIAFDEPTAAIDPLEESALYNKLREISEGKIGLLITHRIGSARIADEIVVMNGGRVSERGTHEELMERKGEYYEMVKAQAKWYTSE